MHEQTVTTNCASAWCMGLATSAGVQGQAPEGIHSASSQLAVHENLCHGVHALQHQVDLGVPQHST